MNDQIEFWRRRERQERAAAKHAGSVSAQRVHQEMAMIYASLLRGARPGAATGA